MMRFARSDLRGLTLGGVVLVTTLSVVVPCLAGAAPPIEADREAPVIHVPPVRPVQGTESLRLVVRVQDKSGVATVTLWAKGEQGDNYRPFPMTADSGDDFVVELPSWPGRGDSVSYYVEATDRFGNGPGRTGDPGSPFIAHVKQPHSTARQPSAVGPGKGLLAGVLMTFALIAFLVHRARSRQPSSVTYYETGRSTPNAGAALSQETEIQRVEEDLFWFRLLSPLLQLSPDEASSEIDRLSDVQLRNPVNGMRIGGREPLMQRLEWARGVDPQELRARRKHLLGAPRPGQTPRVLRTGTHSGITVPKASRPLAAVADRDPVAADPPGRQRSA